MSLAGQTTSQMGFYLTRDLMFSSRVTAAAASQNLPLSVVDSVERLKEKSAGKAIGLVFIDLELVADNVNASIAQVRQAAKGATLVAYAGHVKESLFKQAVAAEVDIVLTRGQFNQRCAELLKNYLAGSS